MYRIRRKCSETALRVEACSYSAIGEAGACGGIYTTVAERCGVTKAIGIDYLRCLVDIGRLCNVGPLGDQSINPT